MDRYCRWVISMLVVSVLSACGLIDKYLTLQSVALEVPVQVLKEGQVLSVEVHDSRENKEVVGTWGDGLSYYLVRDSVADLVKDALSAEFVRRGYVLGGGGIVVKIHLIEFFCRSDIDNNNAARIMFEVQVCGRAGICADKITIHGGYLSEPLHGEGPKEALENALSNSIVRLFDDKLFRGAIAKASVN